MTTKTLCLALAAVLTACGSSEPYEGSPYPDKPWCGPYYSNECECSGSKSEPIGYDITRDCRCACFYGPHDEPEPIEPFAEDRDPNADWCRSPRARCFPGRYCLSTVKTDDQDCTETVDPSLVVDTSEGAGCAPWCKVFVDEPRCWDWDCEVL